MTGPLLASYIALWVLVIVGTVAIFALYQHFGEMYLNSREGRESQGPEVNSMLRPAVARGVAGSTLHLPVRGKPAIMVFASTDCTLCGELRPDLKRFAEARPEIRTLLICAGDREGVARWADGLDEVAEVIPDPGYRTAARYGIGLTPFLVGVDATGTVRAKGIVNDLRGLEAVAEQILSQEQIHERHIVKLEERK